MKKTQIAVTFLALATLVSCGNPDIVGSSQSSSSKESSLTTTSSSSIPVAAVYGIRIDVDEGATISGLPTKAKEGDMVRFTLQLKEEKKVLYVTIDGENALEVDSEGNYSFTMPSHEVTVKAVTEDIRYALSVTQIEGATIALSSTWAKKGEEVKVRVTISDPNKSSPVVHAGETEVEMGVVGDPALKTFEGSFVEPGAALALQVTLSDAPMKLSIQDRDGDGAKVNAPSAAAAGETVTFSITLEPGVESVGLPVVLEIGESTDEVEVPLKDLGNGSYSFVMPSVPVVITQQTKNSIYQIHAEVEHTDPLNGKEALVLGKDVVVPSFAVYQGEATVEVTENDSYVVDQVLVDGKAIEQGENGYSFVMPAHEVNVKVVMKPRLYAIDLQSSSHIRLRAFVKDQEGHYAPVPLEGVNITQQVYLKAEANEGYDVDTIEMIDGSQTRELSLDEDGYYSSIFATPSSKDKPTLSFHVSEAAVILKEGDFLLGSHEGIAPYSYGSDGYTSAKAFELSPIGKGIFSYSSNSIVLQQLDTDKRTFVLSSGSSYYHGAYFESGMIWVYSTSAYSETSVTLSDFSALNFYLPGGEAVETKEILSDNSTFNSVKQSLIHLKGANHDAYAFVTISGSYTKSITVNEAKVAYKNAATTLKEKGAVMEVTVAGAVSYYHNNNGLLATYVKGEEKTYTGAFGSIAVDGFGNATITKDGTTKKANYTLNGGVLAVSNATETLYLRLAENDTYTQIQYVPGKMIGARLDSSSYFGYLRLGEGFQASFSTNSSYTPSLNPINVNADGTFYTKYKDEWFVLSPDGKSAIYRYSSSATYFLSTRVDEGASSHCEIQVLWNKDKTEMLATLRNNFTGSTDKSYVSVYYDGTHYVWGTLDSPENLSTDGQSLNFTKEDGTVVAFRNNGGKLLNESTLDGYQGTYTNGTDTLVLDGAGTATYKGDAGSYTLDDADSNKIHLIVGTVSYEVTLDKNGKTFTAVAGEVEVFKKTYEITSSTTKGSTLRIPLDSGDSYAVGDKVLIQVSGVNNTIYYKGSVACTYVIYAKGDRSTVLASGSYTGKDSSSFDFSFESSKSYDVILTVTEASSEDDISVMIESDYYGGEDW